MKLKAELNGLIKKFSEIQDKIHPYALELYAFGEFNDFETRLAWDCLRSVVDSSTICSWYETYGCTDDHITSLAKAALRSVYTINF